jgi:hypothetical protein
MRVSLKIHLKSVLFMRWRAEDGGAFMTIFLIFGGCPISSMKSVLSSPTY